jgi:hypothetical protein
VEEFESIKILPQRKSNAIKQHSGCLQYLQSVIRKRIETTFSLITGMFSRKIHAAASRGIYFKTCYFCYSIFS